MRALFVLEVESHVSHGSSYLRAIVRDLHTYKLITVTLPKLFNCTKISCHGIECSLYLVDLGDTFHCSKKFLKPYITLSLIFFAQL